MDPQIRPHLSRNPHYQHNQSPLPKDVGSEPHISIICVHSSR